MIFESGMEMADESWRSIWPGEWADVSRNVKLIGVTK